MYRGKWSLLVGIAEIVLAVLFAFLALTYDSNRTVAWILAGCFLILALARLVQMRK